MTLNQPRASIETDLHADTGELVDQLGRFEMVRIAMRQRFEGLTELSWGARGPM
jgi:hypothetical protein